MAQLTVQRLTSAELVLDLTAVAVGFIFHIKVLGLVVDTVWRALLPLRNTCRRLAAALILVHLEGGLTEFGCVSREM